MHKRLASVLLALVTTLGLLAVALPANAAPAKPAAAAIPVSGTSTDPSGATAPVSGTFTPTRAVRAGQGVALLGTLDLTTAKGTVSRQVRMPVGSSSASSGAVAPAAVTPQAVCNVLNLTLGPLHLNLLGLVVDLNQINLNLTAVPGGGLLGDLLCALADGPTGGALSGLLNQLVGLLNQILGAL